MHPAIRVSQESARGCGWRKVGGLYLVCNDTAEPCGRLPIPIEACPCCGHTFIGTKGGPSRGWTWIDLDIFLQGAPECQAAQAIHQTCPLGRHGLMSKVGLIWVGELHYPSPAAFNAEVSTMGISRRIHAVPRDFELGLHYVALAHRKGIVELTFDEAGRPAAVKETPAIFRIFKPDFIEVIVTGKESDEEIEALLERGLSPVVVERIVTDVPLPMDVIDETGASSGGHVPL